MPNRKSGGCKCCSPTPCPPGTSSRISGSHRLCQFPSDLPGRDPITGHPDWSVSVTGPGGYSATPTFTWSVLFSGGALKWSAAWTLSDLEVGTYTVTASGLAAVSSVRTFAITSRCNQALSFIDEPKSRQVIVSVNDVGTGSSSLGPKLGATVTVSGWRSATATVLAYGSGSLAFLQFPDIAPPTSGTQNDRIAATFPGYCDHVQCRNLVCSHSMFIGQSEECPPGGFYPGDGVQTCPDEAPAPMAMALATEDDIDLADEDGADLAAKSGDEFATPAVMASAQSEEPRPPIPLADSLRIVRAIRECPHRTAPTCGCHGVAAECSREDQLFGGKPYYSDCWQCRANDLASKPASDDASRVGRSAP